MLETWLLSIYSLAQQATVHVVAELDMTEQLLLHLLPVSSRDLLRRHPSGLQKVWFILCSALAEMNTVTLTFVPLNLPLYPPHLATWPLFRSSRSQWYIHTTFRQVGKQSHPILRSKDQLWGSWPDKLSFSHHTMYPYHKASLGAEDSQEVCNSRIKCTKMDTCSWIPKSTWKFYFPYSYDILIYHLN